MYDLKIVVEEVRGFCDLPHRPGDYFEVVGSRLIIPEGRFGSERRRGRFAAKRALARRT